MIYFLVFIFICVFLSFLIEKRSYAVERLGGSIKKDGISILIYAVIIISLALFSGLRSKYNDTGTYKLGFQMLSTEDVSFFNLFEGYGGFNLYQKIIKKYISADPQMLIFITAIFITLLYVPFMAKYSYSFGESMMLFMITNFLFTMAGLKQAIAIGISLYAIVAYLEKKYFKAIFLLLIAFLFHPYIICLLSIPLLKNKLWDKKTILLIITFFILFLNFEVVFSLLSFIGKDYSNENFFDYTINPFRVIVGSLPILISFKYRKKINESGDKLLILGSNMQIISALFLFTGLFVNPIYPGRMASYFSALYFIVVPKMLNIAFPEKNNALKIGYYMVFILFFLLDLTKLGSISIFYDQLAHISFFELFGW
ncbi:MAG: EpsG family protein [Clostridia bacterium]|nr:EpsG family protein [Clostridia bacterium]